METNFILFSYFFKIFSLADFIFKLVFFIKYMSVNCILLCNILYLSQNEVMNLSISTGIERNSVYL